MLLDLIDETHRGEYDFISLRMDFKNRCNVGYAFINFIDPKSAVTFALKVRFDPYALKCRFVVKSGQSSIRKKSVRSPTPTFKENKPWWTSSATRTSWMRI
jgi:hypothetical protein